MRRPLRAAALALAPLVAVACGTTVSTGATGVPVGQSGDSLSVPSAGSGGSSALGGAAGGSGASGTTLGAGAGSGGSDSATGSGNASGGAAGGNTTTGPTQPGATSTNLSGPGVTATTIRVGIIYSTNADELNKASGANGITTGDEKADSGAVIDYINKHGGVAGRKLVPVYDPFDSTSTQTIDQQYAAACAKFTQDDRVFAALDAGVASYRACMQKAGVVQLSDNLPEISDEEFAKYPGLVELGYPRLGRIAATQVAALADQGYFNAWNSALGRPGTARAKVGILTYDSPAYTEPVDSVLVPGLKRLGYDPMVERISDVKTASDYGSQAAAVQSAELQFKSNGVDHVIMFESNGGLSLFFMNQAESQHYFPRYGVNSTSGLEVLINSGDVQKQQAVGAMGFGWAPGIDLTADRNPDNGPYSSPARQRCLAIMKAHGITFADSNSESVGLSYCNTLTLLKRSLDTTPQTINAATFVAALNRVGSYDAGGFLGEYLAAGRHDGVAKMYYWDYFADCKCMHYTGPRRVLP